MNTVRPVDQFFLNQEEPAKGCLEYLRAFILGLGIGVVEEWRYKMPFYFYKGKRFCYLRTDKRTKQPYIGFVDGVRIDHPSLIQEGRIRMKILPVDPLADLPMELVHELMTTALSLHGHRSDK